MNRAINTDHELSDEIRRMAVTIASGVSQVDPFLGLQLTAHERWLHSVAQRVRQIERMLDDLQAEAMEEMNLAIAAAGNITRFPKRIPGAANVNYPEGAA